MGVSGSGWTVQHLSAFLQHFDFNEPNGICGLQENLGSW